jgi:hypothetical protein
VFLFCRYELTMLECNRQLVQRRPGGWKTWRHFDIRDAATGHVIGFARERPGFLNRLLRWLLPESSLPLHIEVREEPDDSLVFSLARSLDPLHQNVTVFDAMDERIGSFCGRFRNRYNGITLLDREGRPFAQVSRKPHLLPVQLIVENETVQLGSIELMTDSDPNSVPESSGAKKILFELRDEVSEQPLVRMVLLSVALAIAFGHCGGGAAR